MQGEKGSLLLSREPCFALLTMPVLVAIVSLGLALNPESRVTGYQRQMQNRLHRFGLGCAWKGGETTPITRMLDKGPSALVV